MKTDWMAEKIVRDVKADWNFNPVGLDLTGGTFVFSLRDKRFYYS